MKYVCKASLKYFLFTGIAVMSLPAAAQTGAEIYRNNCAGCHGDKMQGSAAGSALIKKTWKYGGSRSDILKNISDGIPGTTMISWRNVLTAKEMESVTDFILQSQSTTGGEKKEEKSLTVETKLYRLKVEKLVSEGLTGAWGIEFADAGLAFITGNKGELYRLVNGKPDPKKITGLPTVIGYNLVGGMMDLALDPDYAKNGWIYIAYSHNPENSTDTSVAGMTKIIRGKVRDDRWVEEQTLFQVHDSLRVKGGMRWGSRLLFDKDGYLYFTIGDMQAAKQSGVNPQLLTRPEGKIYRISKDGSIPKDNPLYGKKDVLQAVYAWGTRNVQGLAQDPRNGSIYFSDHGPQGGDELNILKKGGNYGWPYITYGVNYDGSIITTDTVKAGMEQPLTYWTPSIAVCAVEFVTGNTFPKWQNNILLTSLKFQELRRLVIEGNKVTEQEILLKGYGRVRDVKVGPDGALYVLTNGPDALLRITPN